MAHDSLGTKNQPQYSGTGAPSDAADLSEVSNYAAYNGNNKVDLSTVRTGLTGADVWDGLMFYETDTGLTWRYKVNTWVKFDTVERAYNGFDFGVGQPAGTTLVSVAFASRPYASFVDVDIPTQIGNGGAGAGTYYVGVTATGATINGPAFQPFNVAAGAWESIAQTLRLSIPANTAVTLVLASAGSASGIWHGAVKTVRSPQ